MKFSDVEVREYRLTLGDHPSAKSGLPVTIDWWDGSDHNGNGDNVELHGINAYEFMVKNLKRNNRYNQSKLTGCHTRKDFMDALMECQIIKESRLKSFGNCMEVRELLLNGDLLKSSSRALKAAAVFGFGP